MSCKLPGIIWWGLNDRKEVGDSCDRIDDRLIRRKTRKAFGLTVEFFLMKVDSL
jgi:hypothetical protein